MIDSVQSASVERRREVDFMRAVMVFGLILFHTARIFDLLPFNVKNDQLSLAFTVLVGFVSQWGMPLFFLIAGIAARHALASRTTAKFVKDRFKRLIVPFIFGMLVIVPPLHYFTWRTNPDYQDSYWQFYRDFFDPLLRLDLTWVVRESAHFWFLYYLFAFSMMLLPLFVYLKGEAGSRLVARLGSFFQRGGAIFLLALPIIVIETFIVTEGAGGWHRYAYIPFLIYGYLVAADSGFENSMYRQRRVALAAGALSMAAFFAVSVISWQAGANPSREFTLVGIMWRLLKSCCSWFWVVSILGWVRAYTHRDRSAASRRERAEHRSSAIVEKVREYATEAVLPFYIIHQTVIIVLGYYIVKWESGVGTKYVTIVVGTFAITLALYEVIRRTTLTRFLFGMKTIKREPHSGRREELVASSEHLVVSRPNR